MTQLVRFASGQGPKRAIVLYDGRCRFCKAQLANLTSLGRAGSFEPLSFQDPGVLERFDGLTHAACMEEMKLVLPDGRVFGGMEAAVRVVSMRAALGLVTWVYYVPGIRQLMDWGYRRLAEHRYRIAGEELPAGGCDGGACAVHFGDES